MCYLSYKIWGRQDYLESDISSLSLSKPFFWCQVVFFEIGQLIICDL